MWLYTVFGWSQASQYLKSVFLEILYVTIRSVFQNLVTYNYYALTSGSASLNSP